MSGKKIMVLMDWYLPGTKAGGPVRSVYSLLNLLKDQYSFYLVTTNKDLGSDATYKNVAADTWILENGIHYYYFSTEQLKTEKIEGLIREVDPDVIYVNSFWSYFFSIFIVRGLHKGSFKKRVILAPRGMLSRGALGLKSGKKRLFLMLAKIFGWYNNIIFQATQDQEAREIKQEFKNAKVLIAPNVNSGVLLVNKSVKEKGKIKLVYLSRIAKVKNLHFGLEVLSTIPSSLEVEYDLFGNLEDASYWQQCEAIIASLPPHIKVSYKRELAFNEVQPTLVNYHCLFLPTLNENFGHSIVEALLSGCPAIISDQTPWNDLADQHAGYALSLGAKSDFKNAILKYGEMNQEEFSGAGRNANNYISGKINLEAVKSQYSKIFNGQ